MDGETGFARGDDGGDGAFGDLFALAQNAASSSEEEESSDDDNESGDNAAAADAAPLEPGAARAVQQQVAEAQAQPYRPPIAGAAPLGGGAAVAAALAALAAAALAAVNFAVVAWIGLFVYGFFVAIAVELAKHALRVARGWPRMIVEERRCQLGTAACAVVLTAYPASLLLFESGLLAPLAVPLGYIGGGFFPMALWMRKAERW